MAGFTHTRDTRRLGRDEEEGREELRQMLDDGDVNFADLIAACIAHAPEHKQEEVAEAAREIGQDKRGPRHWARDRLELRRHARDRRRMGRDLSAEELTSAGHSGSVEEFNRSTSREAQSIDRRAPRTAADMAYDAQSRRNPALRNFRARYPGAARIQRF